MRVAIPFFVSSKSIDFFSLCFSIFKKYLYITCFVEQPIGIAVSCDILDHGVSYPGEGGVRTVGRNGGREAARGNDELYSRCAEV